MVEPELNKNEDAYFVLLNPSWCDVLLWKF